MEGHTSAASRRRSDAMETGQPGLCSTLGSGWELLTWEQWGMLSRLHVEIRGELWRADSISGN